MTITMLFGGWTGLRWSNTNFGKGEEGYKMIGSWCDQSDRYKTIIKYTLSHLCLTIISHSLLSHFIPRNGSLGMGF